MNLRMVKEWEGEYSLVDDENVTRAKVRKRERHYNIARPFTRHWWDLDIPGVKRTEHETRRDAVVSAKEWFSR